MDVLWTELQRGAERFGPRYDLTHGACATCGLGATAIRYIDGFGWWARCDACATRWPLGARAFDRRRPVAGPPSSSPSGYGELLVFARCAHLQPQRFDHMKKSAAPETVSPIALFDPWPNASISAIRSGHFSTTPPAGWAGLLPDVRQRLGAALVAQLRDGVGAREWLRAHLEPVEALGVGAAAARYEGLLVSDVEEQTRWRAALLALEDPSLPRLMMTEAVRRLEAGGGLLAALRAQRAALDAHIAVLEQQQPTAVA